MLTPGDCIVRYVNITWLTLQSVNAFFFISLLWCDYVLIEAHAGKNNYIQNIVVIVYCDKATNCLWRYQMKTTSRYYIIINYITLMHDKPLLSRALFIFNFRGERSRSLSLLCLFLFIFDIPGLFFGGKGEWGRRMVLLISGFSFEVNYPARVHILHGCWFW